MHEINLTAATDTGPCLETTASRLAHLAAVDALAQTLLALRGPRAEHALRLAADVCADYVY